MDLMCTIEENDDVMVANEDTDSEEDDAIKSKDRKNVFNQNFQFEIGRESAFETFKWRLDEALEMVANKDNQQSTSSIDMKIVRARETKKLEKERVEEEKKQERDEDGDEIDSEQDISESSDEDLNEESQQEKAKQKNSFFSQAPPLATDISFTDMNFSRPLLKAVTSLGFTTPTPVQARTIPLALLGKDICACAATGTGKTAAFMLPILERLLYRPTHVRSIRVLVLLPTRELAIQVHAVGKALAQNTKVELCLAAGGLESKSQEVALRRNPDIVIATPGRLVDHLHNTPSFSLQTVEILVLDEADRMLDEHFLDQMNEIIRLCPVSRQTLLFSATMTDEVEELVRLSLHEPIRVFVDSNTDTADNLYQEFIRIRSNKEDDREAIAVALCLKTYKQQCLVFLPTKKQAHRLRLLLGLLGLNTGELHGNLTQLQRLESLKNFKDGRVDILLATDLAARGLDIESVKTVINFNMPPTIKQYIHRVGRTARAGKSGKSVTLVGEKGRKVLKEVMKKAKFPVKCRVIPAELIDKYKQKIKSLEKQIESIMKEEEEEKQLRIAEMEMTKAKNMIVHEEEIYSRPPRVWFEDKSRKNRAGDTSNVLQSKKVKKEETKEEKEARLEMEFAKREMKRARRQKKLYTCPQNELSRKGRKRPRSVIYNEKDESPIKNKITKEKVKTIVKSKGKRFKSKSRYKRRK